MPSGGKIKFFRFVERIFTLIFLGWSMAVGYFWLTHQIEFNELVAGFGVALIIFLLTIYVQRTVDSWLMMHWSTNNYIQEDIFSSLYERSPVGYITLDQRGKISRANPASVKLLKGEIDTIKGVDFYGLVDNYDVSKVTILKSRIESKHTVTDDEFLLKNLEGESVWVILSVYPYRNTGERLVALVDVTDKKKIDTAKSEFVALATHQLRTPIAAIRWNVELLEKSVKETQTDSQARYLDKINRNVIRMIHLINDFLSVSKLEMGTYAAQVIEVNLTEFFSAILDEFSEKITDKQIKINRNDDPTQAVIKSDSRLLHIIVSNLVSNAVKYIGVNGTLSISYKMTASELAIVVADDGIGIPLEEQEQLFTKFYRATNAQTQQTEGTGLGLYIVKQSVEQLGGVITFESEQDQGAKFVVRLPV